MAEGMLGLLGPDPEEEKIWRYGRLNADERVMMDSAQAKAAANKGVQRIGNALTGAPQAPDRGAIAAQMRELAKKYPAGSPEFAEEAEKLLSNAGMVDAAQKMADRKRTLDTDPLKSGFYTELEKLQKGRERARQAGNMDAVAEFDRMIKAKISKAGGSAGTDPEIVKLLNALDGVKDPNKRRVLESRIAKLATKSGNPLAAEIAGLRADVLREQARASEERRLTSEAERGRKERTEIAGYQDNIRMYKRQLRNADLAITEELNVATQLYNHQDLWKIVDPTLALVDEKWLTALTRSSAMPYVKQLEGKRFLSELQRLKETGKNGASGLGQLTEKEGQRLIDASAALDRQQNVGQFRKNLLAYINKLREARKIYEETAVQAIKDQQALIRRMGGDSSAGETRPTESAAPTTSAPAAPSAPVFGMKKR